MSTRTRILVTIVMAALLAVPVVAVAADRFIDVPPTNAFHDDIEWLADAGITFGCNPPTFDEFCPDDTVKRQQMAAFMRRFAAYLGAEDGVVRSADYARLARIAYHATTAGEASHAFTAEEAFSASDAKRVDGVGLAELLWPTAIPPSRTLTGIFTLGETANAAGDRVATYVSYPVPLVEDPIAIHILGLGDSDPACPGDIDAPAADPGHLCVWFSPYGAGTTTVDCIGGIREGVAYCSSPFGARDGFEASFTAGATGMYGARGTWAVTAPETVYLAPDAPPADGTLDTETNTIRP